MRIHLVLVSMAMLMTTACASQVASPFGAETSSQLEIGSIDVQLSEDDRVPDRYDESVMQLIDPDFEGRLDQRVIDDLTTFADAHGGIQPDTAGERMLEFLIAQELEDRLSDSFTGSRPVSVNVDILSSTFPNAATMLLVGEVIGLTYEVSVTDDTSGNILLDTNTPISPMVDRSAGAGGGLLGMALRGGGSNRHILDLQAMARAAGAEIEAILEGGSIYGSDANKLVVDLSVLDTQNP